jgi:hypothetical protein
MSEKPIQKPIIKNRWHYALHLLFEKPSLVLVGGKWKTGKTDFALFIAECLLKLPSWSNPEHTTIISEVASNIETFGRFPMISDMISLKQWLYESTKRKLYILDEANIHLPSRRAMSGKSVEFIKLLAEISKAHARLIVIAQDVLSVDKMFLEEVWCRGVFVKQSLKKAQLFSTELIRPYTFSNIPPTSIKFDPYAIAPFTETPSGKLYFKDEDKQLVWRWLNGESYKQLGVHNMKLNRIVKKILRFYMENELHVKHA